MTDTGVFRDMVDGEPMIDLTELRRIERAAVTTLEPLATARPFELITKLRPHDEDYERVFTSEAVAKARDGYQQWWTSPPADLGKQGQTGVLAFATTADAFATENEYSAEFPGGYRKIAQYLKPDLVWVRFKFVAPGASSGMAYDGLVWLENRFAWFPKPWRVLSGDALIDSN